MWEYPIVAEVHRIRRELAARFNFDIHAMFADIHERQKSLGERLVSPKKQAEPSVETERDHDSPATVSSKSAPAV